MDVPRENGNPINPNKKTNEMRPRGFLGRMRGYFLAGLLVTAPLGITIYLAWIFINFLDNKVTPLIPVTYNPETYLPFGLPGLGLVVIVLTLIVIGALTAGLLGRWVVHTGERILARMPVVRSIYSATKQVFETVLAQQSNAFRDAVLVEYPRRGIWAIGFITGITKGEVQNLTKDETVNVFLPTTPNPTSGFLLFVPSKDVVFLDMSIEEAIKMVISGGIVTPPDRRTLEEQSKPRAFSQLYEELDILREKDKAPILVQKIEDVTPSEEA